MTLSLPLRLQMYSISLWLDMLLLKKNASIKPEAKGGRLDHFPLFSLDIDLSYSLNIIYEHKYDTCHWWYWWVAGGCSWSSSQKHGLPPLQTQAWDAGQSRWVAEGLPHAPLLQAPKKYTFESGSKFSNMLIIWGKKGQFCHAKSMEIRLLISIRLVMVWTNLLVSVLGCVLRQTNMQKNTNCTIYITEFKRDRYVAELWTCGAKTKSLFVRHSPAWTWCWFAHSHHKFFLYWVRQLQVTGWEVTGKISHTCSSTFLLWDCLSINVKMPITDPDG